MESTASLTQVCEAGQGEVAWRLLPESLPPRPSLLWRWVIMRVPWPRGELVAHNVLVD